MDKNFVEIDTSYTDDKGVTYIDGYTSYASNNTESQEEPGEVIGYIFNKRVYYTNPEYRCNPFVEKYIWELRVKGIVEP